MYVHVEQEHRCRGLDGISKDEEEGFECKDVKKGEDESASMVCRMGKEGMGRWLR